MHITLENAAAAAEAMKYACVTDPRATLVAAEQLLIERWQALNAARGL